MIDRTEQLIARIDLQYSGKRLDQALASLFPDFSRTRLQEWVRQGRVSLDGEVVDKPRNRVAGGETVALRALLDDRVECRPEAIPLNIVYQDEALILVNKPAGLVVHPAAGNPDGTLQNALLHHDPELVRLPRAGIVHRLDKDTTGLLVVARAPAAYKKLVELLQARCVNREYRAIVAGVPTAGGTVDAPIGRHPVHRTRMAVLKSGRPSVTRYRVLERFRGHSLLQVNLETGRTHQIRVHMASIRHPLVGDPQYGGRPRPPAGAGIPLREGLSGFRRQALHASKLGLAHPVSGERMEWEADLPEDMELLLELLRKDNKGE